MAARHVDKNQPLIPSILDRLIDEEPEIKREPPKSRHQVMRDMKNSVRRDLEFLLNTRRRIIQPEDELTELALSVVNYGISDFTGSVLGSSDAREEFIRNLEMIIRKYEPRFVSVKLDLLENSEKMDRTLRFRVEALLHAEPAPEPVIFDTQMEPSTGVFEVKDQ